MLQFVEQIATAEFADRIHSITSMHDVIVSNLPEFDLDRDVLKIEFDPKAGWSDSNIGKRAHRFTSAGKRRALPSMHLVVLFDF